MYMARKTYRRNRRSSKKSGLGLNSTVKSVGKIGKKVGNKSVSGVKSGISTAFGFLKSGFGLAYDAASEGVKQGSKLVSTRTRKHRRHRKR